MKKAILTFGLFSLMMVLTSFTSPVEIGGTQNAPRKYTADIGGTQNAPRGLYDIGGTQNAPRRFYDIGGTQNAPRK